MLLIISLKAFTFKEVFPPPPFFVHLRNWQKLQNCRFLLIFWCRKQNLYTYIIALGLQWLGVITTCFTLSLGIFVWVIFGQHGALIISPGLSTPVNTYTLVILCLLNPSYICISDESSRVTDLRSCDAGNRSEPEVRESKASSWFSDRDRCADAVWMKVWVPFIYSWSLPSVSLHIHRVECT